MWGMLVPAALGGVAGLVNSGQKRQQRANDLKRNATERENSVLTQAMLRDETPQTNAFGDVLAGVTSGIGMGQSAGQSGGWGALLGGGQPGVTPDPNQAAKMQPGATPSPVYVPNAGANAVRY